MTTKPCPLCGASLLRSERHPNAICGRCVESARDEHGRRMRFSNTTPLGGGFLAEVETDDGWRVADDSSPFGSACWVDGTRCVASEHRFGGIVAEIAEGPAGRLERARPAPVRLLFVCLGNICRSPTAEAVMRAVVAREGLELAVQIDSAGTGAWHVGEPPDRRATAAARARGVALQGAARQVTAGDFDHYDLLLAADAENVAALRRLAPDAAAAAKVRLLREYDAAALAGGDLDVPDPYFGAADGFDRVLDVVEAACEGLLASLRSDGRLPRP